MQVTMKEKVRSSAKGGVLPGFEDFTVYSDVRYLPVGCHPAYLSEGFVGVCTGGSAVLDIFSVRRRGSKDDLVEGIPHMFAVLSEKSDDFAMLFFKTSYTLFMDVLSGMCRPTLDFFFYMRQHYVFTLVESEVERFRNFVHALACKAGSETGHIRRESVILLLRVFYWDIFVQFKKEAVRGGIRYGHKEELVYKFLNLVTEHYSTNREVSFYADKLCISPKYLTMVVHDVTGKSAKECIVEHTLLEIKSLLREASLDIKDVVRLALFPSQSLLSRFFRKHTGMSPSQYREQAHL